MSIFDAYDSEFRALTNEIGSDISSIKSTPENASTLIKKGHYHSHNHNHYYLKYYFSGTYNNTGK
jgi:hypothetical protein